MRIKRPLPLILIVLLTAAGIVFVVLSFWLVFAPWRPLARWLQSIAAAGVALAGTFFGEAVVSGHFGRMKDPLLGWLSAPLFLLIASWPLWLLRGAVGVRLVAADGPLQAALPRPQAGLGAPNAAGTAVFDRHSGRVQSIDLDPNDRRGRVHRRPGLGPAARRARRRSRRTGADREPMTGGR